MALEVYSKDDKLICSLKSDDAMLGSYPIDDGMRIHVSCVFSLKYFNYVNV